MNLADEKQVLLAEIARLKEVLAKLEAETMAWSMRHAEARIQTQVEETRLGILQARVAN